MPQDLKRMSKERIQLYKDKIDAASHEDLARLYRFAPAGHAVFDTRHQDLGLHFQERFNSFGGMTPEMSKKIGWGKNGGIKK